VTGSSRCGPRLAPLVAFANRRPGRSLRVNQAQDRAAIRKAASCANCFVLPTLPDGPACRPNHRCPSSRRRPRVAGPKARPEPSLRDSVSRFGAVPELAEAETTCPRPAFDRLTSLLTRRRDQLSTLRASRALFSRAPAAITRRSISRLLLQAQAPSMPARPIATRHGQDTDSNRDFGRSCRTKSSPRINRTVALRRPEGAGTPADLVCSAAQRTYRSHLC